MVRGDGVRLHGWRAALFRFLPPLGRSAGPGSAPIRPVERRVRRDRKSLQVRKQEAERRMVAVCDCGVGLHGTLMRGGMERIGGIGGLGLISGKT